jgi:DNA-directed RNA polymerase specialized sigma24 family protein
MKKEILERKEDEAELCTVVKYIEPVFLFCVKRLNNRQDAEDLASEIMVHILNGVKKYHIDSLEKWVWRIAHNRYARFINMRNKHDEVQSEYDFTGIRDDYDFID